MPVTFEQSGKLSTVVLADGDDRAVLAPTRGGILTELWLGGRELLFLDRATLEDQAANVRGGVPVLFPSPGRLTGDAWVRDGHAGAMKQHGFARNLPWEVVGTHTDSGASATLALRAQDATRAAYPFEFALAFTYRLHGGALSLAMRFENAGDGPMPFGAGLHPYFAVPQAEKGETRVPTRATSAWDNREKRDRAFTGLDLTGAEVDLHLYDHADPATGEATVAELISPAGVVTLRGSAELSRWVVWTLSGKDFVCLEPWTCPADALNTGRGLITLAPGEARTITLTIAVG